MTDQNDRSNDDEKDLPLADRDPATLTSEEIMALAFPELETDDNRDGFTELTADELVQMFTMMQGLASTKNGRGRTRPARLLQLRWKP
jgi:hypothetical protein